MERSLVVVLALVLTADAGCGSGPAVLARAEPGAGAAEPTPGEVSVSRMQSAESEPAGPPIHKTVFESGSEPFPTLPDAQVAVRIRAQVNNVAILEDEVRAACYPFLLRTQALPEPERTARQKEILEKQLQALIDREVILQDLFVRAEGKGQFLDKLREAAKKEGEKKIQLMKENARRQGANVQTEDDLRRILREQGLSLDDWRRSEERQFMATEYMRSRIFPRVERGCSHDEIVQYYQEHANEFEILDSVRWLDVFVDASRFRSRRDARYFAEQLAARARSGEDFANLVQYDDGDSRYRHGEGYGQRHGEIKPPELEPVLFNMKEEEVGPVQEVGNGFHVIKVVKREHAGKRPLNDKVQGEIKKKLQNMVAEREYQRLLAEMKSHATVEIATTP